MSALYSIYVADGLAGCYVGCTSRTAERRWRQHVSAARSGSDRPLHEAIRVAGEDAFLVSVVAQTKDRLDALVLERTVASDLKSRGRHVYNADPNESARRAAKTRAARGAYARSLYDPCPHCSGKGKRLKSDVTEEARIRFALSRNKAALTVASRYRANERGIAAAQAERDRLLRDLERAQHGAAPTVPA